MATKMVKAGAAAAAAALAAGVAGMFGGTAFASDDEWMSQGKGDVDKDGSVTTINNAARCGINAFVPISALIAVNMGDQYAC